MTEATDPAARLSRRELIVFAIFCLLNLLVPVFFTDLFPFSRAPMFADAPRRFWAYTVFGPDGEKLDLADFAMQRNYWGNPLGVGCGFRPPASLDDFGKVPEREEIIAHVEAQLQQHPELPFVNVEQAVIAPVDANTVGQAEWHRWKIANPHYRPGDAR